MATTGNPPPMTLEAFSYGLNQNITGFSRNYLQPAYAEVDYIAKRESTDRWFNQYQNVQGIGRPVLNRDLEPPPQVSPITGYQTVIRQQSFRSQLTVEETFTRTARWQAQILDNMQDMSTAVLSMKDAIMANFYNNGFTNGTAGNIVEYDTVARAFFSTGHVYENGAGTWSNYYNVNVPPNPQAIYLIIQQYLGTLKDNAGNFILWDPMFTIVTPKSRPDWGLAADEVVASMDRPNTTDRATNVLTSANPAMSMSVKLRHKSLNNLSSSTKWFIIVEPTGRVFPLRLQELIPFELTPLEKIGPMNPHAWVQTCRVQFGGGFVNSYRGAVAIGT